MVIVQLGHRHGVRLNHYSQLENSLTLPEVLWCNWIENTVISGMIDSQNVRTPGHASVRPCGRGRWCFTTRKRGPDSRGAPVDSALHTLPEDERSQFTESNL